MTIIQSPAEKVLLCDSESCAAGGLLATPIWTGDAYGFGNDVTMASRHNDGINVGYCDGHAKWQKVAYATAPPFDSFVTDLWKWQVDRR